jgi:WD40 repeat protein
VLSIPGGREFVAFGDETIRILDRNGTVVHTVNKPDKGGYPIAVSPDGGTLVVAHIDIVRLMDTRTGELRHVLKGHTAGVRLAVFSPDGLRLFTGSIDQTVKVWDTTSWQEVLTIRHENTVVALALSADGHRLATQDQWNAHGQIFDATPLESK